MLMRFKREILAAAVSVFFICLVVVRMTTHLSSAPDSSHPPIVGGFVHGDLTAFLKTPYIGIDLPPPPSVFVSEMLAVYHSDRPEPTGQQANAWDVKTEGKYYQAVQANVVVVWKGVEKLLLSRRSQRKWVWPLGLDFAVAETMLPGESYRQAIARGIQEELGIDIGDGEPTGQHDVNQNENDSSELRVVSVTPLDNGAPRATCWKGRMPHMKLFDCFWGVTFQVVLSGDIVGALKLQKEEVAGTKLVDFRDANILVSQTPNNFTHWFIDGVYKKNIPGFEQVQKFSKLCSVQCLSRMKETNGIQRSENNNAKILRVSTQTKWTNRYDECQADCIKSRSLQSFDTP